jgi:hypothetical protein
MEVATGVFIKDFGDIFPAHFNKDDTGLWAYNPGTQYFEFYQYRNAATLFLENILFKLNLQQLQMVISICSAMKNKVHAFKGFEEQWKKIVVAGGHISEKEMKYIERLLYMLQATYDKMYGNFPEESSAEESSETSSSSSSDDDMDVDTEDSQEEQPQEETAIIDTLPMDVDHESNVFPELEKAFQRPNQ